MLVLRESMRTRVSGNMLVLRESMRTRVSGNMLVLRGYRFTTGTTDNESRGLRESLNAQPRGLYLESYVGRECFLRQQKRLNAQPRGLYLESYVGRESLASRAEPLM